MRMGQLMPAGLSSFVNAAPTIPVSHEIAYSYRNRAIQLPNLAELASHSDPTCTYT